MKKLFLTLGIAVAFYLPSFAQNTSPWPSTGNVGIGMTTTPQVLSITGNVGLHVGAQRQFTYGSTGDSNTDMYFRSSTSFANHGANGGISLNRLNYKSAGTGNDITDEVGIRIGGFYDNSGSGLPIYLGGYHFSSSVPAVTITSKDVTGYGGFVGIGTTTPTVPLQFGNSSSFPSSMIGLYDGGSAIKYGLGISLSGGINGSGGLTAYAGDRGFVVRNDNITGTENFSVDHSGDTYIRGNVGVGTSTPDAKLAVKGVIHAQEVKVDMLGWSDYVFEPKYDLPTLESVKTYIDKNHRLPEMPSTQEVIKNGVNLGEMVNLQMKKIEELTLYLIEKDKEVADLRDQLNKINEKLNIK